MFINTHFANLIMTYNTLRDTYLQSRESFTNILRASEELGLDDSRIVYLLEQEGLLGKNLYIMLSDLQRIQRGDKGMLITSKKIGLDKSMILFPLSILKQDIERIEEELEIANGSANNNIKNAVTNYCHSLNKIDDIITDLKLEDLLK